MAPRQVIARHGDTDKTLARNKCSERQPAKASLKLDSSDERGCRPAGKNLVVPWFKGMTGDGGEGRPGLRGWRGSTTGDRG